MSTIIACSTSFPAAIAIIRLSGEKAFSLLSLCFKTNTPLKERVITNGTISTAKIKDQAMAVIYKAPKSFTGEDMAEIFIHGGKAIADELILHLINHGAVLAKAGEFTLRAFKNNKIDLSSAEGIINLINAETDREINAAYNLATGKLQEKINNIKAKLFDIICEASAAVDYPEEDLDEQYIKNIKSVCKSILEALNTIRKSYNSGSYIKSGIRVALIGDVNVGKSSLLNALVGKNRAIVTSKAGTTRDTLEDYYIYKGYKFIVIDTAGIRKTTDSIEREGIRRALEAAENSDIILYVTDRNSKKIELPKNKRVIEVFNKIDIMPPDSLRENSNTLILISVLKGINIDALKELILTSIIQEQTEGIIITEHRHYQAVTVACEALSDLLDNPNDLDCTLSLLTTAFDSLGELTGEKASDRIIDEIFSRFCVGK